MTIKVPFSASEPSRLQISRSHSNISKSSITTGHRPRSDVRPSVVSFAAGVLHSLFDFF